MTKRYCVPPVNVAGAVARSHVGEKNWEKKETANAVARSHSREIDWWWEECFWCSCSTICRLALIQGIFLNYNVTWIKTGLFVAMVINHRLIGPDARVRKVGLIVCFPSFWDFYLFIYLPQCHLSQCFPMCSAFTSLSARRCTMTYESFSSALRYSAMRFFLFLLDGHLLHKPLRASSKRVFWFGTAYP